MKRLIFFLLLVGVAAGAFVLNRQQAARYARELEQQRLAWEGEKSELEAAFSEALASRPDNLPGPPPEKSSGVQSPDGKALLSQLANLKSVSGQGRAFRQVLVLLEQLKQIGPEALPAIRDFLRSGNDVVYSPAGGKAARDIKSLTDALVPTTLRFALFDVVRQIGGVEAEKILVENVGSTKRGVELAYLTQLLEELSPGSYKDTALTAARGLLAGGSISDPQDRDYLYGVLQRFNDTSYVATAKTQLVQPDGKVDRNALRYLQQTLGEQSVAVAAQAYQDSRLTEQGSKEPLARVALAYVGANDQALEMYHAAVLDPSLQPDQKRELVEDLNQDGLSNRKTPTPEDLKIIANRYALTQAYLQQDYVQNDKVLNAAFNEADKDLRKLLEKAAAAPSNH